MSVSTTASTMARLHGSKYTSYSSRYSTPTSVRMGMEPTSVRMPVASVPAMPTQSMPATTRARSLTPRAGASLPRMQSLTALQMLGAPLPTSTTPYAPPPIQYAAPPIQYAAPPPLPTSSVLPTASLPNPIPPSKLTEGLPDLNSIQIQKDAYLRALEEQERQALAQLDEQRAQQVEHLRIQGDAQKKAYALQVDQQIGHHDLALTQQHSEQKMMLNQQYSSQRGVLEHQANSLVMDYQQKKAHEDMLFQQYNLQREMHDSQTRFQEELGRIRGQHPTNAQLGAATTHPVLPPTPGLAACTSQGVLGTVSGAHMLGAHGGGAVHVSYTPPPVHYGQYH